MSLAEYGLIEDITPSGGWFYLQSFKDGEQRIPPSFTFEGPVKLVNAVEEFRATNHLPFGNVEWDVAQQIMDRSPMNDRWRGDTPKRILDMAKERTLHAPISIAAKQWVMQTAILRPALTGEGTASERVSPCLSCPHNMEWRSGVKLIDEDVKQRSNNLRQRASYKFDNDLGWCGLHKLLLESAVFIYEKFPPREESAPDKCWIPKKL